MDGFFIGALILIGLASLGVSAYFAHRNFIFARSFLESNIKQAEQDLRNDIHRITLDELMQTKSGKELLLLLSNAEKGDWENPDYRNVAIEQARERELQERLNPENRSMRS